MVTATRRNSEVSSYTEHVFAFELAAVVLLLAIVAAITLTMRRRPGLKTQNNRRASGR